MLEKCERKQTVIDYSKVMYRLHYFVTLWSMDCAVLSRVSDQNHVVMGQQQISYN